MAINTQPPGKIITYKDVKLRCIKALDLFDPNNDVYLLKRSKFQYLDVVAGCVWETIYNYFLRNKEVSRQITDILTYIRKRKLIRESYNGYLLFGTGWYEDNRITRYYGLKRKYKGVNLDNALINMLEGKDEKKVLYQGIKNISGMSIDEIDQVFDRDNRICLLIYLPKTFCANKLQLDNLLQAMNHCDRSCTGFLSYTAEFMSLLEKIIALDGIIISRFLGLPSDYSPSVSGYYGLSNVEVISKLEKI